MSEAERDRTIPSGDTPSKWTFDQIMEQARAMVEKTYDERYRQEKRWGPQNVPNLQKNSNGVHEIGRPYRQFEQIFKYQCDRNRADGHESMDTIWLEEVFEALAAIVELDNAMPLKEHEDAEAREIYRGLKAHAVEELVQAAAVALKFAGKIERDE